MKKNAELLRLLADWRWLTDCECQAILRADWSDLSQHETRKAELQKEITRVLELARVTPAAPGGASSVEQQGLEPMVRDLMALEIRNRDHLAIRCQSRQPESQRLAQTARDLQHMRRAYGPARGPYWQSYS